MNSIRRLKSIYGRPNHLHLNEFKAGFHDKSKGAVSWWALKILTKPKPARVTSLPQLLMQIGTCVSKHEGIPISAGLVHVRGRLARRGSKLSADYVLYFKPNIPIAVIEAKAKAKAKYKPLAEGVEVDEVWGGYL